MSSILTYNGIIPIGSIIQFGGSVSPTGWLMCNGQEISKTTYSNLYRVIGDVYGSPFFPTNFVLPDLRGRIPIGNGNINGIGTLYPLGNTGGSESHIITISEMPSHTHTSTVHSSGDHTHSYQDVYVEKSYNSSNSSVIQNVYDENGFIFRKESGNFTKILDESIKTSSESIKTSSNGSHTHNITNSTTGSGVAFKLLQPYVVLSYIIRY